MLLSHLCWKNCVIIIPAECLFLTWSAKYGLKEIWLTESSIFRSTMNGQVDEPHFTTTGLFGLHYHWPPLSPSALLGCKCFTAQVHVFHILVLLSRRRLLRSNLLTMNVIFSASYHTMHQWATKTKVWVRDEAAWVRKETTKCDCKKPQAIFLCVLFFVIFFCVFCAIFVCFLWYFCVPVSHHITSYPWSSLHFRHIGIYYGFGRVDIAFECDDRGGGLKRGVWRESKNLSSSHASAWRLSEVDVVWSFQAINRGKCTGLGPHGGQDVPGIL